MCSFGPAGSPGTNRGKRGVGEGAAGAHLYSSFQTFPVIVRLYATFFIFCFNEEGPRDIRYSERKWDIQGVFPNWIRGICGLGAQVQHLRQL